MIGQSAEQAILSRVLTQRHRCALSERHRSQFGASGPHAVKDSLRPRPGCPRVSALRLCNWGDPPPRLSPCDGDSPAHWRGPSQVGSSEPSQRNSGSSRRSTCNGPIVSKRAYQRAACGALHILHVAGHFRCSHRRAKLPAAGCEGIWTCHRRSRWRRLQLAG